MIDRAETLRIMKGKLDVWNKDQPATVKVKPKKKKKSVWQSVRERLNKAVPKYNPNVISRPSHVSNEDWGALQKDFGMRGKRRTP